MVAYFFPPLLNSGTQRPLKFAKYLRSYGWEPTVLTIRNPPDDKRDETLSDDLPPDLQILRAPMLNDVIADTASKLVGKRIAEGMSWRLRDRFTFPDAYALWRRPAVAEALHSFREHPYDVIFATGSPWTSLMIGGEIAARTGKPFVADFRDPWRGNNSFRPDEVSQREWRAEKAIVRRASRVVSTTDSMTQLLRGFHTGEPPQKFATIHNGFDRADFADPIPQRTPDGTLRVAYVGVWKKSYGPTLLYDAVERLRNDDPTAATRMRVTAAGFQPGEAHRRGLSDIIAEHGVLSHAQAIVLMRSCDILYAPTPPGNFESMNIPAKLFEYLASGRFVIATTNPAGETGRLLQRVGGGVTIRPDVSTLASLLSGMARMGSIISGVSESELAAYERRTLTGKLAEIFDELCVEQCA